MFYIQNKTKVLVIVISIWPRTALEMEKLNLKQIRFTI